jgi:hypothetical protein
MGFYWLEFLRSLAGEVDTEAVENGEPAGVESEAGGALSSLTRPVDPMQSTRVDTVPRRRRREPSRRLWSRADGFTVAGPRC